jgi:PII-like signaling protein
MGSISTDARLLRIFIGEDDKHNGKPLYEAIVRAAKEKGLAGATVLHGVLGFGADGHMHFAKILEISENLPMIVEIIDTEEHIRDFLPFVETMMKGGMITMEKAEVISYRKSDDQ